MTQHLIAPTVRLLGTEAMRAELIPAFLRGEQICCQLFSEPSAGSDLAALGTRAVREGDEWVINGQKVWSSGAQFSDWGELICRTDPALPKHAGMTAFMIPMDWPGVEVRPLRQMSGGSSFSEVFLTDVRLPDRSASGPAPLPEPGRPGLPAPGVTLDQSGRDQSGPNHAGLHQTGRDQAAPDPADQGERWTQSGSS